MTKLIRIWRLLNIPCEEVVRLVSESLDHDLSRGERFALKPHLIYCKACRRYRRQIAAMREAVREYVDRIEPSDSLSPVTLSAEARQRMQRALDSHK